MMNPEIRFKKSDGTDFANWNKNKLGNIGTCIRGLSYGKTETSENTLDTLVLRSNNIGNNDGFLDYTDGLQFVTKKPKDNQLLQTGDVVICMANGSSQLVGKAAVYDGKYNGVITVGAFCAIFRPNEPIAEWLFQTDAYKRFRAMNLQGGDGAIANFKPDTIEGVEFKMPVDIEEQEKIADFLSEIDALIKSAENEVEATKRLKKAMLQKMFPKKGEKVPEIRFPEFTDDWEQHKFGEIAQRQSETMVSDDDNPCVEYEDVISELGTLNKDIFAKGVYKNGIRFTPEDVLYGKLRPYLHNWLNPDFTGVAVGDWWVLRPLDADKNFLFRLLQTSKYDDAANQSSGTKMPRADWKLISNLEFEIPATIEEQEKIAGVFDNLDNLITLHQRKVDTYKKFKKAMMQKMFV